MSSLPKHVEIAIIGSGPAGLMAAEICAKAGKKPHIFEAMPTPARKFLMAGKSGLNITHNEPLEQFLTRYSEGAEELEPAITAFTPDDITAWANDLGSETFTGSSGHVFPKAMKASPLLRAWLQRLNAYGAYLHTRSRWAGWDSDNLLFETIEGQQTVKADAVILALGGTSWPRLGSDGAWQENLKKTGVKTTEFRPSNCGFNVDWSDHFKERNAGTPVKGSVLSFGDRRVKGDFVISGYGIEGSAVYALSAGLRKSIDAGNETTFTLDLTPDRSLKRLTAALSKPRGKKSFATHLKRMTGLHGVKAGLLREFFGPETFNNPESLAAAIKAVPIKITSPRPIEEAISTAGGIMWQSVDEHLMLKEKAGVFCAGEMIDWDAPTGGYLLTACMAQGKQAANGVLNWLENR